MVFSDTDRIIIGQRSTLDRSERPMTTNFAIALAVDLVGITILAYFIYFRRHYRKDLLLSFVALNVGVVAVTSVLTSVQVGLGLGLGLFGILSIIRLRSDQLTQEEVAYYFVSLAMGLLAGLHPGDVWVTPVLTLTMITVMFVVDHQRLMGNAKRTVVTLDRAYVNDVDLHGALGTLFGAEIVHTAVREVDLVRDTTIVDVRYRTQRAARTTRSGVAVDVARTHEVIA